MNYDTLFVVIIVNGRNVIWEEIEISSTIHKFKQLLDDKYNFKKYYIEIEDGNIYNINDLLVKYVIPENKNSLTIRVFTNK